jgi:hypothetical protein
MSQLNVYPDPKHWWMLPKNHLKKFIFGGRLRKIKKVCKNIGESQNFHENYNYSQKFFAKYFVETETFCRNHPGTEFFAKTKIIATTSAKTFSQKLSRH